MPRTLPCSAALVCGFLVVLMTFAPASAIAQDTASSAAPARAGSVRDRIAALDFPELRFRRTAAAEETVRGVPVYFVEDRELPLVTFYASFKGGTRNFAREHFAAASAMPGLLRSGGTDALPPDSVDERIERLALGMSFGQGGGGASSWVNTLSDQTEEAVGLWAAMLSRPRFDSTQVELWRNSELERVRRRRDDAGVLAFARFNQIMYGEHPVGWLMEADDLEPEDLAPERLRAVHGAVICPDNMTMGVTGDISWARASAMLDEILADWPPCSAALLDDPVPDIRSDPGVFVIHRDLEQSVVVMAHSTPVRQGDTRAYFASRIGDSVLGGSGLSSRMTSILRTREGLAYGASSLWTTSSRDDGLVGALTRTRPESTLRATRLLLDAIDSMRVRAPSADEVEHAVEEVVNGFVFNFRTPLQVIVRGMTYRRLGLPADWLDRYVDGIRAVTPERVRRVFEDHVDPARMTILLVGDTTRFDGSPSELGEVTVLEDEAVEADEIRGAGGAEREAPSPDRRPAPSSPRGSPRSRR